MDHLNRLSSYFNEKEKKRLESITRNTPSGLPEMSEDEIRLSCLQNNGYELPELNDKLYLHFRGFKTIQNLDKYIGCKALWLDSNGFNTIENLSSLVNLRCLYLSKNLINAIDGLENLKQLIVLDLSNNHLTHIDNLACCTSLQTLNLSRNSLASSDSIKHLTQCISLNNIDLTNNRLVAEEDVFETICSFTCTTLSLSGNEVTKIQTFRKRMISNMPKLGYLDRPIEIQERLAAEAFMIGGIDAENEAREKFRNEQKTKRLDDLSTFKKWQQEHQEKRKAEIAAGIPSSYITEFTPEEQEERKAAADKAADDEKKLLELGIDNIAKKYWQMEGRDKHTDGIDLLGKAVEQVATDNARPSSSAASASAVYDADADDITETAMEDDTVVTVDHDCVPHTVVDTTTVEQIVNSIDTVTITDDVSTTIDVVASKEKTEEEEMLRLIAESMDIYKKQKEQEHQANLKKTTWDVDLTSTSAATGKAATTGSNTITVLYWTESLDLQLAQLVRECFFDFDAIADKLSEDAKNGKYGVATQLSYQLISSEECRTRWAHLDASQWSTVAPDTSALQTNFKIYANPALYGKKVGHGQQPSFSELASLSSGLPSYLSPPTSFPSVADNIDDDIDDDDDQKENVIITSGVNYTATATTATVSNEINSSYPVIADGFEENKLSDDGITTSSIDINILD